MLFQANHCPTTPDLSGGGVLICALQSPKFFGVKKFSNDEQTIFQFLIQRTKFPAYVLFQSKAKGFGIASITIFSQKSKMRVYPKLTLRNFGKLLRFLAVLEEQKIVSERPNPELLPYFAVSMALVSLTTVTFIWPGYSISFSIFLAISLARVCTILSSTSSGSTIILTSRPA
jgi:hypothetical protein